VKDKEHREHHRCCCEKREMIVGEAEAVLELDHAKERKLSARELSSKSKAHQSINAQASNPKKTSRDIFEYNSQIHCRVTQLRVHVSFPN